MKLSDGSFFYVSYRFYYDEHLGCGIDVDEELLTRLEAESQRWSCYRKALDYITMREHSRFEITRKLMQKGFQKATVDLVCNRLEEKELLDDERFASQYLERKIKRNRESRMELAIKLSSKGISASLSRELLNKIFPSSREEETASHLAQKALEQGKSQEKIKETLLRKGFPYQIVKKILSSSGDS